MVTSTIMKMTMIMARSMMPSESSGQTILFMAPSMVPRECGRTVVFMAHHTLMKPFPRSCLAESAPHKGKSYERGLGRTALERYLPINLAIGSCKHLLVIAVPMLHTMIDVAVQLCSLYSSDES